MRSMTPKASWSASRPQYIARRTAGTRGGRGRRMGEEQAAEDHRADEGGVGAGRGGEQGGKAEALGGVVHYQAGAEGVDFVQLSRLSGTSVSPFKARPTMSRTSLGRCVRLQIVRPGTIRGAERLPHQVRNVRFAASFGFCFLKKHATLLFREKLTHFGD